MLPQQRRPTSLSTRACEVFFGGLSIPSIAFVEEVSGAPGAATPNGEHDVRNHPDRDGARRARRRLTLPDSTVMKETLTMPQYLLSVWHDDDYADLDFASPEMQRVGAQVSNLNAEMERAGAWVFGVGLRPASSATVVRSAGGDVSMTDGPYAETKEQMGGFWIIEAADLDAALDWATKAAAACEQPIEVRPTEDA
jgi:hypothetical protein